MSSEKQERSPFPRHIAIIMDGNGRWAKQRGLPRIAGHRAGVENIRRILPEAIRQNVQVLTLYAFSTENWSRPRAEVDGLMTLLSEFIERELNQLHAEGVRVVHLGRPEALSESLRRKIVAATELTKQNTRLTVAVALNYGGRAEIVDAVQQIVAAGIPAEQINESLISQHLSTHDLPDPDMIIRTSGEWRLSNFLIWQAAYSEYWTTPDYWPDFSPEHLKQAINDYGRRERRFGGLTKEG